MKLSNLPSKVIPFSFIQSIFWKLKCIPVNYYHDEFSAYWSSCRDDDNVNRRLKEILSYAANNVPAYSHLKSDVCKFEKDDTAFNLIKLFPISTKKIYRENSSSYISDNSYKYFENSSGGSTGEPVKILQDLSYKASTFAATQIMYEHCGRNTQDKLVKLWGAERDLMKGAYGVKQRISDFINNVVTINAFVMSRERMFDYVKIINKHEPVCLEGYADSLYSLACFIEDEKLEIFSPELIISSAGTLYDEIKIKLKSVFRTNLYDRYGCREVGNIAIQDSSNTNMLRIFSDTNYVEVVDKDGESVGKGEEGRILLTNLHNKIMPIIRYEIGDLAIWGGAKPYPMLERITGRTSYAIKTYDGGYVSPVFFAHFFGVMLKNPLIMKFQITQKKLDYLELKLKCTSEFDLNEWIVSSQVNKTLKNIMGDKCVISIILVDDIASTSTGKHNYITSEIA